MFQHLTQPLISALLLKTHLLVVTLNTTLQALPATLLGKESGVSSSTIQGFLCSLSRSLFLLPVFPSLKPCALQTIYHLFKLVLSKPTKEKTESNGGQRITNEMERDESEQCNAEGEEIGVDKEEHLQQDSVT